MRKILLYMILFLIVPIAFAKISNDALQEDYSQYNENLYKKYVKMDMQLKSLAEKGVKSLLPYLLEAREHLNISRTCTKNMFDLITGFRKLSNWSFNFFDAMGKLQSGLQTGNLQMFGEYEECIETTVTKKGNIEFRGQYCLLECKPYLPKLKKIPSLHGRLEGLVHAVENSSDVMKLLASRMQAFYAFNMNIGLCVPSGCSKQDMSEIVNYTLGDYINCTVSHCIKEGDDVFWTTKIIIIVSIFVLLGLTVIVSTWLDNTLETWKNNTLGFKCRILQCFSLSRNFPKFMSTDVPENSITCFNGIRVLNLFYVILGHEFFFHAVTLTANHISVTIEGMLTNFFSQIGMNAFVSVEMFFFISGFVNCYSRMRIKKNGKPQPGFLKVMIHRLWRIYPAYIITILLYYLLIQPQPFNYSMVKKLINNCDCYWWQNILFINNFFPPLDMCLAQSWFLCVDMQLFLLTLFTIPVLLRNPKKGFTLHVAIIMIFNTCAMSWWLTDDIAPSTLDSTRLDRNKIAKGLYIYFLTPVHVGPYIVGLLFGYIIAAKEDIKIPKVIQLIGWPIASLLFISMTFMTLKWNSGIPYTQLESAFYGAWNRTILVLGFSWLVLCCSTGHAGLINYILSLKLWIPLSRITYMLFLVSPLIQGHYFNSMRFPEEFSTRTTIWNYFANTSISILLSIALVLVVESPMIAMEKVIFGQKQNENKATSEKADDLTFNNVKGSDFHENGKITTIHL